MARPQPPECRQQGSDSRGVARWEGPMVGVPAEPGKTIKVGTEQQFRPRPAKDHLQYTGGDARSRDRGKEKGRDQRPDAKPPLEGPQARQAAAPTQRGEGDGKETQPAEAATE